MVSVQRLALTLVAAALLTPAMLLPGVAQTGGQTNEGRAIEAQANVQNTPNGDGDVTPAKIATLPNYSDGLLEAAERLPLELTRLQKAVQRVGDDIDQIAQVRIDARDTLAQTRTTISELAPLVADLTAQLDRLGPPPKDGEPPETDRLAAERAALVDARTMVADELKRLRLTEVRLEQLISRLTATRRQRLATDLITRESSPLAPQVWSEIYRDAPALTRQIVRTAQSWLRLLSDSAVLVFALLVAATVGYALASLFAVRYVRRRIRVALSETQPLSFLRRAWLSARLAPAFALPAVAALAPMATGIYAFELTNRLVAPIFNATLVALSVYILVAALARAILLPATSAARLIGVDDAGASRLSRLVRLLALVSGLDLVLTTTIQTLYAPAVFMIAAVSITNLVFAALLMAIVWTRVDEGDSTEGGMLIARLFNWARLPMLVIAIVIVIATLFGFLNLGRFLSSQVMVLGIGGTVGFLCHRAIVSLSGPEPQTLMHGTASADEADTSLFGKWATQATLHGLLLLFGSIALLLSWGFSTNDLSAWITTLIVGFDVGGMRISPAQVVLAILLFVGLIFLTRLIQRWVAASLNGNRRFDPGVANSIETGLGYAGFILAALAAISYAGFDFTNLAIVAGALSVGIGFGLQSIVNNFVSGLILLVERPIKVGDWIVVGANEGYVRRISVRSTEIETFDRASVIVPNSELITGTVHNWTHRNAMGRVVVAVGASYDSDPEQVTSVLRDAVAKVDKVLKYPAPFITFDNLGDSSLEFTIRAYVADINNALSAKHEIRVQVMSDFRAAGLEIPFPQRDVHLRDLDGLKAMLARRPQPRATDVPAPDPPERNAASGTSGDAAHSSNDRPPMRETAGARTRSRMR